MFIKSGIKLLGSILLISALNLNVHAAMIKKRQESLLSIENTIYKVAARNGLTSSDIVILWNQTSSGGYIASIHCTNANKCNRSEITLSFKKQSIARHQTSNLQNQLLKRKLNSLLNQQPR